MVYRLDIVVTVDLSFTGLAKAQKLAEWYTAVQADDSRWLSKYDEENIYAMAGLLPQVVAELVRLRAEHNQQREAISDLRDLMQREHDLGRISLGGYVILLDRILAAALVPVQHPTPEDGS